MCSLCAPWLSVQVRNERSAAVARRSGFVLEGTLHCEDRCPMTNELRDTLIFAKVKAE